MDRFLRILTLHNILRGHRYPVSPKALEERLECGRRTLGNTVEDMRNYLDAPIAYDHLRRGYYYDEHAGAHPYELPGLWFNASELHSLLAARELLSHVQPGLLEATLEPLKQRIEKILAQEHGAGPGTLTRIRILSMAGREPGEHFQIAAGAVLQRRRLFIRYHGRADDRESEREISPQRLTRYRDNWYLDAWCHTKQGLRSFSVDRIRDVRTLDKASDEIPDAALDEYYASAYGIFAGKPEHTAVLRFTPRRTRWVADEKWHAGQKGFFFDDGSYELSIPYGDPRELVMDILKYGPEVEVKKPLELRRMVTDQLEQTLARYHKTGG